MTDAEPDGVDLIALERQRQVDAAGYSSGHDDGYYKGEMATAALCLERLYLACVNPDSPNAAPPPMSPPTDWPFTDGYKGEADPIRYLIKAGALIAAEIDRINRGRRQRAKKYADDLMREMRKGV